MTLLFYGHLSAIEFAARKESYKKMQEHSRIDHNI